DRTQAKVFPAAGGDAGRIRCISSEMRYRGPARRDPKAGEQTEGTASDVIGPHDPPARRMVCLLKSQETIRGGPPLVDPCRLRVLAPAHGVWSVVVPIDPLVKGLSVERAGSTGQQSTKSGRRGIG